MEERNTADVRWEELELFRRNNTEDGLLMRQKSVDVWELNSTEWDDVTDAPVAVYTRRRNDFDRGLTLVPKRDEFRADRTLDGLLKVWLKHLPKPEYDNLTDEDLDDDLNEPPLLLPDFPSPEAGSLV